MRRDPEHFLPQPHFSRFVRSDAAIELSVVVPLYEESTIIPTLLARLLAVLDELCVNAEVILIDDGSRDDTFTEAARAARGDSRIRGLSFSRNFGHQAAISAGLAESRGKAVLVMDGDLQDPPEAIPALWNKFQQGFDVVYAIRASRPEGWLKRLAYRAYYRVLDRAVTSPIPLDAGDFGIMSRRVVDLVVAMPERRRFIRGLRAWVGFRQTGVPVARGTRHAGRTKFTLAKLVSLAIDGLVGFSEGPLRPFGALGAFAAITGLLGAVGVLARGACGLGWAPAWGWLGLAGLFFGGAQLLSIAVVGEYMTRILHEVNARPRFVIDRRIGSDATARKDPDAANHPASRGRPLRVDSTK
jgi:dolichol-phosphate mannosyltransferase